MIFLLLFTLHANDTCLNTSIRYLENKVYKTSTADICTNATFTSVRTKNCKQKICERNSLIKRIDAIDLEENDFSRMPPALTLCRKLEGTFQFFEFQIKNKWHTSERCIFKDLTFVDSGSLYKEYLILNN